MNRSVVSDILELSVPERIQIVEEIWNSIAAEEDGMEPTETEKKIIDERLDAHCNNPDAGSSWEDVYMRITRKLPAFAGG